MPSGAVAVLVTLVVYKVLLLAIGFWAQRRNQDEADFILGGRRMGPFVAAISASASSSSAWTLLGVSGYAYTTGLSAVWLFPSCVGGFVLNWYLLAPRLRRLSAESGALTVTEYLAGPPGHPLRRAVVVFASVIVLVSLLVYVASQFQGAGKTFAETFDMSAEASILLGSAIVVAYTLLGGFWAVSLTDTLQGCVMALTAVALPVAALVTVGGFDAMFASLESTTDAAYLSWTGDFAGAAALGLILGMLGIGLGYPGQPHVVNRFMALRDDRAVVTGRRVALTWGALVYAGMILLGLCARALTDLSTGDHEAIFVAAAHHLFPPVVAGVMIAAVLSAVMSTADSQLLVAASTVSHDLHGGGGNALARSRLVVLALSAGAVAAAVFGSTEIFSPVLFAWTAMGAAFGPLLMWTVWRGLPTPGVTLAVMATGFVASIVTYSMNLAGLLGVEDRWVDRILPFALATAVLVARARRR